MICLMLKSKTAFAAARGASSSQSFPALLYFARAIQKHRFRIVDIEQRLNIAFRHLFLEKDDRFARDPSACCILLPTGMQCLIYATLSHPYKQRRPSSPTRPSAAASHPLADRPPWRSHPPTCPAPASPPCRSIPSGPPHSPSPSVSPPAETS